MSRPLKVGVQLPEVEYVASWPQQREMALAAEAIGLDSVWVGDHLLYRDDGKPVRAPWEAWSTLAALAAVTRRVALGPLVAATSFHNPAMIAKKAATIDEISGGRLILGLGAGWNRVEYDAYGFPSTSASAASRRRSPSSASCCAPAAATSAGSSTGSTIAACCRAAHGRKARR